MPHSHRVPFPAAIGVICPEQPPVRGTGPRAGPAGRGPGGQGAREADGMTEATALARWPQALPLRVGNLPEAAGIRHAVCTETATATQSAEPLDWLPLADHARVCGAPIPALCDDGYPDFVSHPS